MFRFRPLAAAVLCTAALAACSDTTGTDRGGDALVNATNRNLPSAIVTHATQSETVTRGFATPTAPSSYCTLEPAPAYSVSGEGANAIYQPCPSPYDPYEPAVVQPVWAVPVASITGSSYQGTKTVNLSASGSFTYASFGQLTAIFQTVGGCPTTTPSEYSRSNVSAQNAPFTLSATRSASYTATTSLIKWGVHANSYAESPEGGSGSKISTKVLCY